MKTHATIPSVASQPSLKVMQVEHGLVRIIVGGNWTLQGQGVDITNALQALDQGHVRRLELSAKNLAQWDSTLLVLTTKLVTKASERGIAVDNTLPEGVQNLTRLALAVPPNTSAERIEHVEGILAKLGGMALSIPKTTQNVLAFFGDVGFCVMRLLRGRSSCTMRQTWLCIQECGVESLAIVSLISMLVGLILAFVGVIQLSMFNAEIYVSSLVAVGMTRIMGAIMTGVILSGRMGASYAAVIGTMQVNEEVDALSTLGIDPYDFLLMPRLIAMSLMTPILVIYADFMGILGGFFVGVFALGLDPAEYIAFSEKGFTFNGLWVGVFHGFVFGIIVALTGCYQGLRCGRSAEAVGVATTSAVVYSIVGIVVATAILTITFNVLGL